MQIEEVDGVENKGIDGERLIEVKKLNQVHGLE